MTIDKAIRILKELKTKLPDFMPEEPREAMDLGIEALKRVQEERKPNGWYIPGLLPGETEGEK